MKTRSSPSLSVLHKLAERAEIPNFGSYSKAKLFERLNLSHNLGRLSRATSRGSTAIRKRPGDSALDVFADIQNYLPYSPPQKRSCYSRVSRSLNDSSSSILSEAGTSSRSSSSSSSTTSLSTSSKTSSNRGTSKTGKRRMNRDLSKSVSNRTPPIVFDPILFEPIKKPQAFEFVRPNGSVALFNAGSLIDYMLSTGDFGDPETRIPFSDEDLETLDKIAKGARLNKPSVKTASKMPAAFADLKFRRDALLGLERCAGEVIADILGVIENESFEDAQLRLFIREYPLLADYYRQIYDADGSFAKACLQHWRSYIEGPPNRPTRDACGILRPVLSFLRDLEESFDSRGYDDVSEDDL